MLDLSNLSTESYAAFILAIVFTVITLAGAIVLLRRSFKASTLIKVITTIVFPFVAIFCWLYMIMDTCSTLEAITCLYSSFLITLGFFAITIGIYYLTITLIKKKKESDLAYVKSLETEVEDLEKTLNEKEAENVVVSENTDENDDINEVEVEKEIEVSDENEEENKVEDAQEEQVEEIEDMTENTTEELSEENDEKSSDVADEKVEEQEEVKEETTDEENADDIQEITDEDDDKNNK